VDHSDVVVLEDVYAAYEGERQATLSGLSLFARTGEQIAITGPNGAGKTTVLEVINGLLPIASGSVRVFGNVVIEASHHLRAAIAYVPQNLFFAPDTPFLVKDVVHTARFARIRPWQLWAAEETRLVESALEAVGMRNLLRRPIGRLSGGQQRKVLLARAVAQQAKLLLLDEPTANLDPEAKCELAELIGMIRRDLAATSVVVSHEAGPLLDATDRTIQIEAGRQVAEDQLGKREGVLVH